jgi:hypothetical protein
VEAPERRPLWHVPPCHLQRRRAAVPMCLDRFLR